MTRCHRSSRRARVGRVLSITALAAAVGGCAAQDGGAPLAGISLPTVSIAASSPPAASTAAVPVERSAPQHAVEDAVGLVVVGDSITAGADADDRLQTPGDQSWVPAATGAPLEVAGGWAVPGATTQDMRTGVTELPPVSDADVLVLLAGTNDLSRLPWSVSADDLRVIVATVAAERVLIVAIPPFDPAPQAARTYNDRLRSLAVDEGWDFIDPWTEVSADVGFVPGATVDGVHPTPETAQLVGRRLREALLAYR